MTELQRLQRAHMLVIRRAADCSPASAWREVSPDTSDQSDAEMAEMYEREVDWLVQWLKKHPEVSLREGTLGEPRPKWCIGVDDRPCGKKILRRRKRCRPCAAEQIRLNRRGYNRNYFRSHKEPLNAKRNERRRRQRQRERDEAAAAAEQAEKERHANLPRVIVDERTGKMRPCATCTHPDRAAIEAELLLQADSLRTITAHHGISPPALLRHRCRHMTEPSVGDILEPDGKGDSWREWDGTKWQRIDAPRREHLKEVQGRPAVAPWRRGWSIHNNFAFHRKVYRRKQSRTRSTGL